MFVTIKDKSFGEFIDKKSKFIAYIFSISNDIEAKKYINRIKNDNKNYPENINKTKFLNSLNILEKQYNEQMKEIDSESNKTPLMYTIISIYTTFILEEPIHPINTPFPANQKIILKEGIYYCPVKHNNIKNPTALCKLCIAHESEELN